MIGFTRGSRFLRRCFLSLVIPLVVIAACRHRQPERRR